MITSFILAFFDPVIFVPAALIGWFSGRKAGALALSFVWALGSAFLSFKLGSSAGVLYDPLLLAAKIPPALAITLFMCWVRRQLA